MSDAGGPPPGPPPEPYPGWAQETQGPVIVGVTSALTALATLFVLGRLYSRILSIGKLQIDDYIMIFSMMLGWAFVGMGSAAVYYGGGRHLFALKPENLGMVLKLTVISFVPGLSSFMFPKFAVVILLAKLLNPSKPHKYFMWGISVFYTLMIIVMLTLNFAQCTPAAAQWGEVPGTCMARKYVVYYAMTVTIVSALFDLYLAMYPTWVLWNLQLNLKKKVALCASLGFGYCAAAVTIYKCTTFPALLDETNNDFTYGIGTVYLWTNIEANFVVIGACIPLMLPVAKKIFGSSAFHGSSGATGPTGQSHDSKGTPLGTFGSSGKSKKSRKSTKSTTGFDTVNEDSDSKYIILEERSFQFSEAARDPEETSTHERVKAARGDAW